MRPSSTPPCPFVRGDLLARAKKRWRAQVKSVPAINQKRLLRIDPSIDAYVLGNDGNTPTSADDQSAAPIPLHGANGVVHTVRDLSADGALKGSIEYLRYQDWCMTRDALESAIWWAHVVDHHTHALLADFRAYLAPSSSEQELEARALSKRVCVWGGRAGIFGNMDQADPDLGKKLSDWFAQARNTRDRAAALAQGVQINGLGPSFASKHLRFIDPQRYATLDNILAQAFGFPMEPAAYEQFLRSLESFKTTYQLSQSIADLEHGLFYFAQPFFSSDPPQQHKQLSDPSPYFGAISQHALARDFAKVTEFSPIIDIYRRREGPEHWYGIERPLATMPRHALKFVLMVDSSTHAGSSEVCFFSVASKALNVTQTREYLSFLYPAHSLSGIPLEWPNP